MTTGSCPDCGTERTDWTKVCPACGAPPAPEHRAEAAGTEAGVRTADLEPYIALRYIARLFKVLAVLMVIMLLGEVVTGLLWAGGDMALLLIDAGHDLRVARILLGRINAAVHKDEAVALPPREKEPRR